MSMIQNYGSLLPKQGLQNSFVYGYNRNEALPQKHNFGSFGTLGQLAFDSNLAMLFEKVLGIKNYLQPAQNFKPQMSSTAAAYCDPNTWCGELPPRNYCNPVFSPKVFIGGIPWDISEQILLDAFLPYGPCTIQWPGSGRGPKAVIRNIARSKASGYVYIIFEAEDSVRALLQDCAQTFGSAGELYFRLRTRRQRTIEFRQVQVIPWSVLFLNLNYFFRVISDSMYIPHELDINMRPCFLDISKTIFVGALHGMMTASILGAIMEEQFGAVVYVGINSDKNKYPIGKFNLYAFIFVGSGRVTFSDAASYNRAIDCEFLEVRTSKFAKKIQIDPFLKDANCSICDIELAPYFCRHKGCLKYFCSKCFQAHSMYESDSSVKHRALIYKTRRASANSNEESFCLNSPSGISDQLSIIRAESSEST